MTVSAVILVKFNLNKIIIPAIKKNINDNIAILYEPVNCKAKPKNRGPSQLVPLALTWYKLKYSASLLMGINNENNDQLKACVAPSTVAIIMLRIKNPALSLRNPNA